MSEPVVVGVSGGADSLCLLDVLWRLHYPLVVVHLNHRLRPEADSEAQEVEKIAKTLGVPFVLEVKDVANYARKESLSVEEAARIVRYKCLFEEAIRYGAQAVAVGHNADDQVETMLMHLLRGSGLAGLTGMAYLTTPTTWSREIPLVRPLLSVWRDEIISYLAERDLQPIIDFSNLDTTYFRNRLRHELIPYLKGYNPQIRQVLWRTTNVLQEDHVVLESIIQKAWQDCLLEQGKGFVGFDVKSLRSQSLGLQRHLFRRAIANLQPGLRDVDYDTIGRAVAFMAEPAQTGQSDLFGGLRLLLEGNHLWVASWDADLPVKEWPQVSQQTSVELDVPGMITLNNGWELRAELVDKDERVLEQALTSTSPFQAWLDANKLEHPLTVRSRQPGDRFKPLGMGGRSMKLADFMVNEKIPRRARTGWPIVYASDEIIWVPGYRMAHSVRVIGETQKIMLLILEKKFSTVH